MAAVPQSPNTTAATAIRAVRIILSACMMRTS